MNENESREIEIEELACAVCNAVYNNNECGSCQHLLKSKVIARKLFDNGVRRIPDGAVVLNIGKNNEALDEKTIEFFVKHNAKVRKETAREILKKIYDKYYWWNPSDFIQDLAKEYGVEL